MLVFRMVKNTRSMGAVARCIALFSRMWSRAIGLVTRKPWFVVVALAVIATVLGIGWLVRSYLGQLYPDAVQPVSTQQTLLNNDFYSMDQSEIKDAVDRIAGVDLQVLRTKKLTASILPTYEKSLAAARALDMTGDRAKSLEAYQLAATQIGRAKLPMIEQAEFYYQFGLMAYRNKDKALAHTMLDKATALTKQSDTDEDVKASQLNSITIARREWDQVQ